MTAQAVIESAPRQSVAVYLVKAALYRVPAESVAALLEQAGIAPELLLNESARVPAAQVSRLWQLLSQMLGDEFFAFDRRGLPRGAFAQVCRSALHESDVAGALKQCVAGLNLFLADLKADVRRCDGGWVIRLRGAQLEAPIRAAAQEIYLSMLVGLMCWLAGRRLVINRSRFSFNRPAHSADPILWGALVEYQAAVTEIEISAAQLQLPVVRDVQSLTAFLKRAPHDLLIRFRQRLGVSTQVYRMLKSAPGLLWPSQVQMAQELGISESALRRALEREGYSYQLLKDEVRKHLAFEVLRDCTLSIAEVAVRCGFQEPSAFHRAFRKWTGISPGRFREQLAAAD